MRSSRSPHELLHGYRMPSETARIQEQLRRAITGDAWHGPSVFEAVAWFDAGRAARRVASGSHSAWEIVLHIAVWLEVVRERLAGKSVEPTSEQDWPPVPRQTAAAWNAARLRLTNAYQALQDALDATSDDALEQIATGTTYTNYFMLHGVVQHSIYHAGQLTLIERSTREA